MGERVLELSGWTVLGLFVAAAVSVSALPAYAADAPSGQLDALRRQAVAAAGEARTQETAIAALEHEIRLLRDDAAARRRGLDDSRAEQERLLGAIELVVHRPPARVAFFRERPIDRARSEMLAAGTLPALRARSHALAAEYERIASIKAEIAERDNKIGAAQSKLAEARGRIAKLGAERQTLIGELTPKKAAPPQAAKLARGADDLAGLIDDADAAAERRDKVILTEARAALPKKQRAALVLAAADPTRPAALQAFDPPQSALIPPVSGNITGRFGADETGTTKEGLDFAAPPGAEVVAPFDGRVVYAGPFKDRGLVLILRHGPLYHSVLAGLGRVDVTIGQWVLGGEPVAAMPGPASPSKDEAGAGKPGDTLHFELRRDGRPVDPQPWLASRDEKHDAQNGVQKVRE